MEYPWDLGQRMRAPLALNQNATPPCVAIAVIIFVCVCTTEHSGSESSWKPGPARSTSGSGARSTTRWVRAFVGREGGSFEVDRSGPLGRSATVRAGGLEKNGSMTAFAVTNARLWPPWPCEKRVDNGPWGSKRTMS